MAHLDRMVMVHVWGMREEQNSKRAQKQISNKAPREPMDAMHIGYVPYKTGGKCMVCMCTATYSLQKLLQMTQGHNIYIFLRITN